MFGIRGPESEPLPVCTPTTSWSASATVRVPRRASSSPDTTVTAWGTSTSGWSILVAETTTLSSTGGALGAGVGLGVGDGRDCPVAADVARPRSKVNAPASRRREPACMFLPPFVSSRNRGEKELLLPQRKGKGTAVPG